MLVTLFTYTMGMRRRAPRGVNTEREGVLNIEREC